MSHPESEGLTAPLQGWLEADARPCPQAHPPHGAVQKRVRCVSPAPGFHWNT